MANKIIKGIEGVGKAIGGGIKKVIKSGSFEPNYIENRLMPKQASDFARKQKAGALNSIPKKNSATDALKKAMPKNKRSPAKPTFNQVQKSVLKTMGK